jgi:hypothetical protein
MRLRKRSHRGQCQGLACPECGEGNLNPSVSIVSFCTVSGGRSLAYLHPKTEQGIGHGDERPSSQASSL